MTTKNKNLGDEQAKILECVIEQNWLHARHVENERLWFTNIYLVVVAGILSYLGSTGSSLLDPTYRLLIAFLLIFSVLGLIVTSKLSAEFGNHIQKIQRIFNEKAIALKDYMGLPLNVGLWKYFKVRQVFMLFYLITAILWLLLLILPIIPY